MTVDLKEFLVREVDTIKIAHALCTTQVFTPAQLANHMDKTIQTLHNWRRMGLLEQPIKVGNYTFWTLEQVQRLQERLDKRQRNVL